MLIHLSSYAHDIDGRPYLLAKVARIGLSGITGYNHATLYKSNHIPAVKYIESAMSGRVGSL